jgi:hypothetical protein
MRNLSLFEAERLTLEDAIEMSITSLNEYGQRCAHVHRPQRRSSARTIGQIRLGLAAA